MTAELQELQQYLDKKRVDCVLASQIRRGEITVDVAAAQIFGELEN